jgi:streptogramin lyase
MTALMTRRRWRLGFSFACRNDGDVTDFVVPTPNSRPDGITVGPAGAVWFTERLADKP